MTTLNSKDIQNILNQLKTETAKRFPIDDDDLAINNTMLFLELLELPYAEQFENSIEMIVKRIEPNWLRVKINDVIDIIGKYDIQIKIDDACIGHLGNTRKNIINLNDIPVGVIKVERPETKSVPIETPKEPELTDHRGPETLINNLKDYAQKADTKEMAEVLLYIWDQPDAEPDYGIYISIARKFNPTFPEEVKVQTVINTIKKYNLSYQEFDHKTNEDVINLDKVPQQESGFSMKNTKKEMYEHILKLEALVDDYKVEFDHESPF